MTVQELIQRLEKLPHDAIIGIQLEPMKKIESEIHTHVYEEQGKVKEYIMLK